MEFEIVLNMYRCKSCGICIAFCPKEVLATSDDGKPEIVNLPDCIGCRMCELRCPDAAVEVISIES